MARVLKTVWVIVAVFVFTIQEIRSDWEATDDSVKFIAEYFLNQENAKASPQALSDDQHDGNTEQQRNGEQDQLQMNLRSLPLDDDDDDEGEEVVEDAIVEDAIVEGAISNDPVNELEEKKKKKKMILETLEQIRKVINESS